MCLALKKVDTKVTTEISKPQRVKIRCESTLCTGWCDTTGLFFDAGELTTTVDEPQTYGNSVRLVKEATN